MDCIDEGGTFCLNIFYTGGTCYEAKERFETMRSTYSYCSDENKKAPSLFKYWVCPNEAACESKVIVPSYDGDVLARQVDKWSQKFVQGDVCSYLIDTPWQMTERDVMYLRISKIENAAVYVAKGKSYLWLNHLDAMAADGDIFDTKMDWKFYVVGVANEIFKGTFKMQIWIEKNKAKKLLDPNPPEPKKKPAKEETVKEDEKKDKSKDKDTNSADSKDKDSKDSSSTTDKKDSTKSDDKNTPPKDKTDPSASTVTVIPDPLNDKDKFATLVDGEVDLAKQALIIKQQELMAIQYQSQVTIYAIVGFMIALCMCGAFASYLFFKDKRDRELEMGRTVGG